MEATVTYYDPINDVQGIEVGTHYFEFGGQGDGYCYKHQSFDCLDNLSDEEREALRVA